jgi:mannose-6-phosphate isomerase-like protein (cupin superfamily)/ribosome-binding protein aMBF1 (putative translation factor)
MTEDKNEKAYEDISEAVDGFTGHGHEHDFLTDPDAEAAATRKEEMESAVNHGANLRTVREEKGFSLEELAEKTGIEKNVLELVEAGEDILPLGRLIKLSKALSLRMEDVVSKGKEPFTIVRAHQRPTTSRYGKAKEESHGYEYESLAPSKKDRRMEPFIVTLHPASSDEPSTHDGQEFIYVLEGEMEVFVEDTREVLKAGDAVYYDSTSTHLVRAFGDKPTKIIAVLLD